MSADNHVAVAGNVTRDPELKYTQTGVSITTFGIAVSKKWKNKTTDEWDEQTSFFNVTCWRGLADNVAATVTKGMRVAVTGELEQRSWETDAGEKRSVVQITADDVSPSLRYATADVAKVSREGAAPKSAPAPSPANDYADYGEEPF